MFKKQDLKQVDKSNNKIENKKSLDLLYLFTGYL